MTTKQKIIRNFSRHAHVYDRYADVQNRCGHGLIEFMSSCNKRGFAEIPGSVNKILEIGCGTGNYTRLIREKFKAARIKAVDLSMEMIIEAKKKMQNNNVEFIVGDAENMEWDESYDLVTSNACFQWFFNLEKSFVCIKKALRKEGIILFSIFGPGTFSELNKSLFCMLGAGWSPPSTAFLSRKKIEEILSRNFGNIRSCEMKYEETFKTVDELLRKIKYTGETGHGLNNRFIFSKKAIENMGRIYRNEFGGIKATYQIFFFKALK